MTTGISTLGQSLLNIEQIKNLQGQYGSLSTQLNTGRKTQQFSGLGFGVTTTLRSRTEVNQLDVFQSNITNSQSRTGLMLNAIEEFQEQAQIFEDLIFGLSQESLHQKGTEIFAPNTVTSTGIDLSAIGGANSITTLIAGAGGALNPPNDQFTITFEDTVGDRPLQQVVIDISDAQAAAGAGNAQAELIGYINTQLAAVDPDYSALATAGPGGTISIEGRGNITISGSDAGGMGAAGLAALGFAEGTTSVTEDLIVGKSSEEIDADLETLRRLADKLYDYLVDLLNIQQDDRYLLGGADTRTRPIENNGILDTAMSVQINDWKTGGFTTTQFISNLQSRNTSQNANAFTDSIVGYSASLSAGNVSGVSVKVSEQSDLDYTVLANEQGFRDVLVAVSLFRNDDLYPLADVYADPYTPGDPVLTDANGKVLNGVPGNSLEDQRDNFFELLSATRTMVNSALEDINDIRFELENTRARMSQIEQSNRQEKAIFENIISENETVDINVVAVQLNTLSITLQASFSITAQAQQLSLVNFI